MIALLPAAPTNVPGSAEAQSIASSPLFAIVVTLGAVAIVFSAVVAVTRWAIRRRNRVPNALQYAVLLLTVPKESEELDQREREKDFREQLAVAETLFLSLGGIKPQRYANILLNAWNNFWYGRADHLSFEIVAQDGLIKFYLAVPRHLQRLVELQIHAQYPHAHIEEAQDYNIFTAKGAIHVGSFGLAKRSVFPLRTYKKLDTDPLSAITNTLSKLQPDEGAAIQLLIRPAPNGWQRQGQKIATDIHHGKKVNQALGASAGGFRGAMLGVAKTLPSSFKKTSEEDMREQQMGPRLLTPMEQELVKSLEEKASKYGFDVNLRVVTSSPRPDQARMHLLNITNAFSQYTAQESGNAFRRRRIYRPSSFTRDFIFRHFRESEKFILNTEEVTSLYHLPLPSMETPNILWLQARSAPPPVNLPNEGIVLGTSVYRGVKRDVRIKRDDRRRHVYIIGTTGSGKSVLMSEMVKQDIANGEGVAVVDPHGSLIEDILMSVPKSRADDVVIFDPSDTERPVGLNMLEAGTPEETDFAVQEMIAIFMKLFPPEMIGPMFEHNMRNAMLTLMADKENPGTIAEIPRMFTDKQFQDYKVSKVTDPVVRAFWEKEMAKTTDFHKSEMLGYLISKVGRFVENAMMRNIIGQPQSGFNVREIMDQGKILLVNLSKGKTGEVNSSLLGLIIVSKLQMAALSRADMPESQRRDFFLYIDEFQNFITDSIATILSEARKYKLDLTLAHQYLGQLSVGQDTKIRDAVLGNVGTMISFRVGVEDAEILAKQYAPVFTPFDLVNISRFNAYFRLLIDNTAAKGFNVATHPPTKGRPEMAAAIKQLSRLKYGRDRASIESEILERSRLGASSAAPVAGLSDRR
jgi:hypothetical protein